MRESVRTAFDVTQTVVVALAVVAGIIVVGTVWAQQPASPPSQPAAESEKKADRPRGAFSPVIRLFDADNDGSLSKQEIDAAGAKLQAMDANKDGKLTAEEMPAPMMGGPAGPGGFGPGREGRRGPGGFGPGGPPGGPARDADFSKPLVPKDDFEKNAVKALEEMRQGPRFANVSTQDGRLLRQLTEAIGAKRVVEIGTSTGESGVWFALALRRTGGKLYTHELDPQRAKTARANFKKAGVDDLITLIEGDAHETVKQHKEPIDILFLDADKEGYIDYLEKLMPLIRPGGLIIAHNMNPRQADPRYLEAVTTDPKLETSFLLMEGTGVGVTMKKR